jgi:hypothetical protein
MSCHHGHAQLNLRKKDKAYEMEKANEIRESLSQYERI